MKQTNKLAKKSFPAKKRKATRSITKARQVGDVLRWWRARRRRTKILLGILVFIVLFVVQAYAIAYWYQQKHRDEALNVGVTYISDYSEHLGLDPRQTMLAIRDDLGVRRFRLVSYWKNIEPSPGVYDFSDLDWQFDRIEEVGGSTSLALGLRQPRWPECHVPEWAHGKDIEEIKPQLYMFIAKVVDRYKDRPSLTSYQLENEFFLDVFGECTDYGFERQRLIDEFNIVKGSDPHHPIILSLANNYFGIPTGQPRADQIGVSVYKRVWDKTVTKQYFEYPFPSWYYAWRAGLTEIFTGKNSMLHELQAEPWPPTGILDASLEEQDKSMNAELLKERIHYGVDTGFRDIDLWGAEWWYWRKIKAGDPSLWETARQELGGLR